MKRLGKVVLIVLVAVCAALAFTACSSVQSIGISQEDAPRTTYVQGQELDLSQGKITYTDKSGEHEIALNGKGVEVSGYNKDLLGWQDITVKYGGETTSFGVNVVERMVFDAGVVTDYFIGESFNTSVGSVKVTFDNGESTSVYLSDPSITVSGFDSSSAKTTTATVRYNSGNYDYSYNISVNVYSVSESSVFIAEAAKSVLSHNDINLSGSTVTLSNGMLNKTINVTKDMLSGYKPEDLNSQNKTAEQTVKVTYAGIDIGSFTVNVTYSNESLIFDAINAVKNAELDFAGNTVPVVSEEVGEVAVSAVKAYFSMSKYEKASIAESDLNDIVRAAAVYCNEAVKARLSSNFKTLVIENGEFKVSTSASKADAIYDISALTDGLTIANSDLLSEVKNEFGELDVAKGLTISDYVGDTRTDNIEEVYNLLSFLVELYDVADSADAVNWISNASSSLVQIMQFASDNENDKVWPLYAFIAASGYDCNYYYYYSLVLDTWLGVNGTAENIFGILYNLCDIVNYVGGSYGGYTVKGNYTYTDIIPVNVFMAYAYVEAASNRYFASYDSYKTTANIIDNSMFMYYMYSAEQCFNELSEMEEKILENFYVYINYSGGSGYLDVPSTYQWIYADEFGYAYNLGIWIADDDMLGFWDLYINCLDFYYSGYLSANIPVLFEYYAGLTPDKQAGFLRGIHSNYDYMRRALTYDSEGYYYNAFIAMLDNFYYNNLSTNTYQWIFNNLLLLIEDYASGFKVSGSIAGYLKNAQTVLDNYEILYDAIAYEVDEYFAYAYVKYVIDIPAALVAASNYTLSEEHEALFMELSGAIAGFFTAQSYGYHGLMYASYLKSENIVNRILNSGNNDLINAYRYKIWNNDGTSLSYNYESVKVMYGYYANGYGINGVSIYDYINAEGSKLSEFYNQAYGVMMANGFKDLSYTDADSVKASLKLLAELSDEDKFFVHAMMVSDAAAGNANTNFYFNGLIDYFTETVGNDAGFVDVVESIGDAMMSYFEYLDYIVCGEEIENPEKIIDDMFYPMTLIELMLEDSFGAEEKALFNEYFKECYDMLKEFYDYMVETYGEYNSLAATAQVLAAA